MASLLEVGPTPSHIPKIEVFQIGSCYIPIHSKFYADQKFQKNLGSEIALERIIGKIGRDPHPSHIPQIKVFQIWSYHIQIDRKCYADIKKVKRS